MQKHGLVIQPVINGQSVITTNQECYVKCCRCSLVHLFKFSVLGDNEIAIVAYRDDYLTKLSRHTRRPKDKRKRKGQRR